ncbi:MAG: 30S ribosomal protein S2 [Patulibacter minatonensis]
MSAVDLKDLLQAGVHFGHQTRRWNPKMKRFIHGEIDGIYIIDLLKTEKALLDAQEFASALAHRGGKILFVGTKKQAKDSIQEHAARAGQPFVQNRWLGGLLTNFGTIQGRIKRLHDLERYESEGQLKLLPTRERLAAEADLAKLRSNLGGAKTLSRLPDAIFIVDLKAEAIAVQEAQRLRIPIIGLVDTNCDPDGIDIVVPGNDDSLQSCELIIKSIADVVAEGNQHFKEQEELRLRREAEERAKRDAEERARREAEAAARKKAEEEAAAAAAAQNPQAAAGAEGAAPAAGAPRRPSARPSAAAAAGTTAAPGGSKPGVAPSATSKRPSAQRAAAAAAGGEAPAAPAADAAPAAEAAAEKPAAAKKPAAKKAPAKAAEPKAEETAAEAPATETPAAEAATEETK